MISKYQMMMWLAFENSGMINDYLKYKLIERWDTEAGEDLVTGEDIRRGAEDNKIR